MKTIYRFHTSTLIPLFIALVIALMISACNSSSNDEKEPSLKPNPDSTQQDKLNDEKKPEPEEPEKDPEGSSNDPEPDETKNLSVTINGLNTDACPEIKIYASIVDENNRTIENDPGLSVKVIEDGVEKSENIGVNWIADGDAPVSVVLAMDYSLSMVGGKHEAIMKDAVNNFIELMKPEDKAAIIKFYYTPQTMVGFTSDKDALRNAVDAAPVNDKYTNIHDTIYSAVDLATVETGPVAVILITDGGHSMAQVEGFLTPEEYAQNDGQTFAGHTLDEALTHANNNNVPVYTIGYKSERRNHDELKDIAAQTGGGYYAASDENALNNIYSSLFTTIEGNQHEIAYTSDTADDEEHTISIEVEYNSLMGASENKNFILCPESSIQ